MSFFVLNIDRIRSGAKVKMQKAAFYGEEVVFPKIRLFYTSYHGGDEQTKLLLPHVFVFRQNAGERRTAKSVNYVVTRSPTYFFHAFSTRA